MSDLVSKLDEAEAKVNAFLTDAAAKIADAKKKLLGVDEEARAALKKLMADVAAGRDKMAAQIDGVKGRVDSMAASAK